MAETQPTEPLGVRLERDGDSALVAVEGEVDIATAPTLRASILEALDGAGQLILDLGRVTFLDSTGLTVLMGAFKRCRNDGIRFSIARPQARVRQVFAQTGLDTVFTITE
jgi:anti-sigma B factor antagonist